MVARSKRPIDKAAPDQKIEKGDLGDVSSVGDGVFEMREHFGPGWRMYYKQKGQVIILMLGGGDKSTQQADISKAILLSKAQGDEDV